MAAENGGDDLEEVVERYHQALGEFMKGNHDPAKQLFSERDDVTLGNPFGPFARGWTDVVETMKRAASNYREGEAIGFDRISKNLSRDLAYIVEVERLRSKVGGREETAAVSLRVTGGEPRLLGGTYLLASRRRAHRVRRRPGLPDRRRDARRPGR